VDEQTQASYMMRTLINYAGLPVDKVFYYDMYQEVDNPLDGEFNLGLLTKDFRRKPAYNYYRTFEEVFGQAVSEASGAATFTCSNPYSLEAHCFNMLDGSLAIAVWKSDDQNDSLTITVNDKDYESARLIDPVTEQEQSAAAVSRDGEGRMTVSNLALGKTPLIVRVDVQAEFKVSSITPNRANQFTFFVSSDIEGAGFQPGATVRLDLDGQTLNPLSVKVTSTENIRCALGFFLVAPGRYDVVVRNPDGQETKLDEAVEVEPLWW
jgi:hypothetical protein